MSSNNKRLVWRGLTAVSAGLMSLAFAAQPVVNAYRTEIDNFLGTASQMIVTEEVEGADPLDAYTYLSDFENTKELVENVAETAEKVSAEGSVLLKNKNNALPLGSTGISKVTLLGINSYEAIRGGEMGSTVSDNTGTDADTIDIFDAYEEAGFTINPTVATLYQDNTTIRNLIKNKNGTVRGVNTDYIQSVPGTGQTWTNKEVDPGYFADEDADWADSLGTYNNIIVTFGRSSGENKDWIPGEAGVNATEAAAGQTDPLGLTHAERELINVAHANKGTNGKVIVVLNSVHMMEIDELKNSDKVDAILWIGSPGAYGSRAVADIIKGDVNPSGHMSDTFAVDNASSPAAQNHGAYAAGQKPLWDLTGLTVASGMNINSYSMQLESIYVGYKYYETIWADSITGDMSEDPNKDDYDELVSYPFGYGLSYGYEEVTQTLNSVSVDLTARTVTASVTVTNESDHDINHSAQLYVSVPYTATDKTNKVEKSAIQLLDYTKVEVGTGDSETVTITANAEWMASWDSAQTNVEGGKGTYVLAEGEYCFTLGNGSHEANMNVLNYKGEDVDAGNTAGVKTWNNASRDYRSFAYAPDTGTLYENNMESYDINWDGYNVTTTYTHLTRDKWNTTFPADYRDDGLAPTEEMIEIMENDITPIEEDDSIDVVFGAENNMMLADVKDVADLEDMRWTAVMDQITLAECMERIALGGTSTKVIPSITSPFVMQNDGPNGFSSNALGVCSSPTASAAKDCVNDPETDPYLVQDTDKNKGFSMGVMPCAPIMASTFNQELMYEVGVMYGNYSIWSHLTMGWLAGANLHRTPYCGRNHEYYSEDGVHSSLTGCPFIQGSRSKGAIIGPKHFAFNDTEVDRAGIAPFGTEQKARETELRAFQGLFEEGDAVGCMTTFSRVGCYAANSHHGMLIDILREEWGFLGLMSTDMATNRYYFSVKECAINGVTMTTQTSGQSTGAWSYWTVENVEKDSEICAAAKQCMIWQNYAIANSNAMNGLSSNSKVVKLTPWYDTLLLGLQIGFTVLTVAGAAMYVLAVKKAD